MYSKFLLAKFTKPVGEIITMRSHRHDANYLDTDHHDDRVWFWRSTSRQETITADDDDKK